MVNAGSSIRLGCICGLLFLFACTQKESPVEREKNRMEYERESEAEAKAVGSAFEKAQKNEKDGFLELYEIGNNADNRYAVEYQEVANDALTELLCTKTVLWIQIFSRVNGFKFYFGVLPQNISEEKYNETVLTHLNNQHWNKEEEVLVKTIKAKLN